MMMFHFFHNFAILLVYILFRLQNYKKASATWLQKPFNFLFPYRHLSAIRANSLDDERHGMRKESFGQAEARNMNVFHTKRTMARLAIEVYVTVVVIALAFLLAYLIIEHAPSILKGMNHIVLQEKREGSEDARLIHRHHFPF